MGIHFIDIHSHLQTQKMYKLVISAIFVFAIVQAEPGRRYKKVQKPDLIDTAIAAGSFTKLVEIVAQLGLVETLRGVEKATIFAPTDAAFEKIKDVVPTLSTEDLTAIVARHVVPGATVPAQKVRSGKVKTFGGEEIELIKTRREGVKVKGPTSTVNVVTPNVFAKNGVIHVVDAVIL